jgi:hypothetical protein
MKRRRRLGALLLAALLFAAPLCASALADGDPASDVLLGQDVFLPYTPISRSTEQQLYAVTDAARRAGFPLKIALIGARSDLGVVPALFGKAEPYARFLSSELSGVVDGPVLVVMPDGFGLAAQGRALSVSSLHGETIAPGSDGLGAAAITATRRLAAAAGHPLTSASAGAGRTAGASAGTVRHAVIAMLVLTALAGAAIAAAIAARSRRALRRP